MLNYTYNIIIDKNIYMFKMNLYKKLVVIILYDI